ncbi:MAG TPA: VOC family protein [Chloroflexota bacterium]|nr:VOC family protein [Chloroflexota bacterium]
MAATAEVPLAVQAGAMDAMEVKLDHTIVLAPDKLSSALFLGYILGRPYTGMFARFAPVKLDDELCLDYADAENDDFERRTFTLLVSDDEFDGIRGRLETERVPFGSELEQIGNKQLNNRGGGRGLFFKDPNGHIFEITTVPYQMI